MKVSRCSLRMLDAAVGMPTARKKQIRALAGGEVGGDRPGRQGWPHGDGAAIKAATSRGRQSVGNLWRPCILFLRIQNHDN
jgi:hypothetical protein